MMDDQMQTALTTDHADAEVIEGARVVLEGRVVVASVRIEAGLITGLDVARDEARIVVGRAACWPRPLSMCMAMPLNVS